MSAGTSLAIRVWVPDVWDIVPVAAEPGWTVRDVKEKALALGTGRTVDATAYEVKFRGALVTDETRTLEALGVPDHAALIVLPAGRLPVR